MHPYVAQFTMTFLTILTWSIVARALLSFLPIDQGSTIYQVLFRITEPSSTRSGGCCRARGCWT